METESVVITGVGLSLSDGESAVSHGAPARLERLARLPAPLDRLLPRARCVPIPQIDDTHLPVSRAAARFVSAAARYVLVTATRAIDASALSSKDVRSFGIAIGTTNSERPCAREVPEFFDLESLEDPGVANGQRARRRADGPRLALQSQPGLVAANLAMQAGIAGPVFTFLGERLSSGVALGESLRALRSGWCPGMIACGVFELDDPWVLLAHFDRPDSSEEARPPSSAAACLTLEPMAAVRARGGTALAELVDYWAGSEAAVRAGLSERMAEFEVVRIWTSDGATVERLGMGAASDQRLDEIRVLKVDVFGATSAVCAALAVNELAASARSGTRPLDGRRRAALLVDRDRYGQVVVLLIAEVD